MDNYIIKTTLIFEEIILSKKQYFEGTKKNMWKWFESVSKKRKRRESLKNSQASVDTRHVPQHIQKLNKKKLKKNKDF